MTIEKIRANAPEGATHYILDLDKPIYIKSEMVWIDGLWWFATFEKDIDLKPL